MISFTGLSPEVAEAMSTPMHLILPSTPPPASSTIPGALYLGSITAVLDPAILKEHDIHHLVQVLDVPWLPAYEEDGYECYRLDILDTESQDLRPHLEDTVEDIDSALRRGRNVLVHCHQVSGASFRLPSSSNRIHSDRWLVTFPILIFSGAGCLSLGSNCHCVPHSQARNVVRLGCCLCSPASPLYKAQFWFRALFTRVGTTVESNLGLQSSNEVSSVFDRCYNYIYRAIFRLDTLVR